MGQPSSKDKMTIRHQFDRLCQMALKGEAVNYYKHMDYRRKHEVTFSELSEKELSKLFTMDEYGTEYHHFEVHGYDIEVKNTLIAEALKELTERKRNVILLSYFMEMSDADKLLIADISAFLCAWFYVIVKPNIQPFYVFHFFILLRSVLIPSVLMIFGERITCEFLKKQGFMTSAH